MRRYGRWRRGWRRTLREQGIKMVKSRLAESQVSMIIMDRIVERNFKLRKSERR